MERRDNTLMKRLSKDLVTIKSRYQRSANLVRDWQRRIGLDQYILTPTGFQISKRLFSDVLDSEISWHSRVYSITGPYGTGKSAFALFLTDLLASEHPIHPAAQDFRKKLNFPKYPFVPVLIIGQRAPIKPSLVNGLCESMREIAPEISQQASSLSQLKDIPDNLVIRLFEQAGEQIQEKGYQGILIIIDEFGKHLEFASHHPETEDLFILQALAEMIDRSDVRYILITILHSAFEGYLPILDEARRVEWKKIQGRFQDIPFLEPPEQFLTLLGNAIEWHDRSISEAYQTLITEMVKSPALEEVRKRYPISELLPACAPINPITALILYPLFRSKLAQNERSLFSFLTDHSPLGLQDFLSITPISAETPSFYRLDMLYDYVMQSLGLAVMGGEQSRRWAEIDHALERIPVNSPPLAISVIKAIGLINMYGGQMGLYANEDTLKLALGSTEAVAEAIHYLEENSIIVYRRYINAYALWEGSDVNLDERYQEALIHVGHRKFSTRLKNALPLRPFVARAHYIKMGTLRYFTTDIIDGTSDNLREGLFTQNDEGNGTILFVLVLEASHRKELIELALDLTRDAPETENCIIAFPKPISGLDNALRDLEAWTWVRDNTQALQGDPVARKEVVARIGNAQRIVNNIAGQVFGLRGYTFDPSLSDWIQGGRLHKPASAIDFQRWLSELCDNIYSKMPPLHNELLNRERLSSAATSARRNLLEAIINHETEDQLGMIGTPAEVSMYRALLYQGGFHREINGIWKLTPPNEPWMHVWQAMEEYLNSTENQRLPIIDLVTKLKKPPFGLREGPIYVLLTIFILVHRDNIALYEDGFFVPELRIEVFERITRVPQLFEIQVYSMSGVAQEAFIAIGRMLGTTNLSQRNSQVNNLLDIIKPLVLFADSLPEYTRKTKQLDALEAVRVRDTLLKATDPNKLLFVDLPDALGIPFKQETIESFVEMLKNCILCMQKAYPALLAYIEEQISDAFELVSKTPIGRRFELQQRAAPLEPYAVEGSLVPFIREASRIDERDWREVLGRVINQGKPTDRWLDNDVVKFRTRLLLLASEFVRMEELVAEREHSGASRILRIGILDGKMGETRKIVPILDDGQPKVDKLAEEIIRLLESATEDTDQSMKIRIAAIVQAAAHLLDGEK